VGVFSEHSVDCGSDSNINQFQQRREDASIHVL